MEHDYRSPQTLSYLAVGGVGVMGVIHLITIFIGISMIITPSQGINLPSGETGNLSMILLGLIGLVQFAAYIFAVVVFLMWLFRVYKNLGPLRTEPVETSPGWAVGWWFIPLANLIKPFQAVRDAWLASDPDVEPDQEMSFLTSVKGGAPAFMSIWWGLWIVSNILSNISNGLLNRLNPDDLALSSYVLVLEGVLWVAAAVFAIQVIWDTTSRQDQRFLKIKDHVLNKGLPPPPPSFYGQE